ncbi:MAG TPA: Ku protein [Patescibacteria group bacterium]|jgi:DNA end-binding protein Ku|nr:Ku protein [Patescibacteria group bacterium]
MRAIWKGSISFGLVNIPIALYPATQHEELKFRLLRSSDLSPVNYKRVAEADGKEVPWDQIVKGYEYEKGKFVVLKEDDFKRVDVEATQTVDIIDFVVLEEIDPMFFHKPFFMEPAKGGAKSYVLIRDALRQTGKVGIAKVVIKTRQYLAAVKPNEKGLVLELMHFADELMESGALHLPAKVAVGKGEMEMAKTLISRMTQSWRPEKYKDDYKSALLELVEQKIKSGGRMPASSRAKATPSTNVIDLMDLLRQSLGNKETKPKGKSTGRSATRRRKAA